MTIRIRSTSRSMPKIVNTHRALPTIKPEAVANALDAEPVHESLKNSLKNALGPISLFAVRRELARRLKSTGGRPSLKGTDRRTKIPLAAADWQALETVASNLTVPGFKPSAGQVAAVLLGLSVKSLSGK